MSFCARIEEWAESQGIANCAEKVKEWADEEFGWDELDEMESMWLEVDVVEVVEMLREFAETPQLKEMNDAELDRWVAERYGFSWTDSIDELVEDDDEAFVKATAYISAQHSA